MTRFMRTLCVRLIHNARINPRRIAELEADAAEDEAMRADMRARLQRHDEILKGVWAEHQPIAVPRLGEPVLELRCMRCQSDEHHTWKTDNYLPWPCPTLAPFVAIAVYSKPTEEETS